MIQRLKSLLSGDSFARDALSLSAGTAAAQILTISAAPILTRIFAPSEFGHLAVFSAFAGVIVPLVTGAYSVAIPIPKENRDAVSLYRLAIGLTCLILPVLLLVIVILRHGVGVSADFIPISFGELPLLVFSIFVAVWYQALTYIATRQKAFGAIAWSKITLTACVAISQIVIGVVWTTHFLALIIGSIFGVIAASLQLFYRVYRKLGRAHPFRGVGDLIEQGKVFKGFPSGVSPGAILDSLSIQLTPIMLAGVISTEFAGYYALASMILTAPIALVGRAIRQTFFQRIASLGSDSAQLEAFSLRILLFMAPTAIITSACLALVAPTAFSIIFGEPWRTAGIIVQILVPVFTLQFLSNALSPVLLVKGLTGWLCFIQFGLFLATVIPLTAAAYLHPSSTMTMVWYSGCQFLAYSVYFYSVLRALRFSWSRMVNCAADLKL